MSALSVRLPNSLHNNLKEFAEREGISINQLIANAVSEKVAALGAESYLLERAQRASREAFDAALALVPDVEPLEEDRI
jgi:predicted DNA-binding ribbon-helix-helix protein